MGILSRTMTFITCVKNFQFNLSLNFSISNNKQRYVFQDTEQKK